MVTCADLQVMSYCTARAVARRCINAHFTSKFPHACLHEEVIKWDKKRKKGKFQLSS